jgi:hypothetical protein
MFTYLHYSHNALTQIPVRSSKCVIHEDQQAQRGV